METQPSHNFYSSLITSMLEGAMIESIQCACAKAKVTRVINAKINVFPHSFAVLCALFV